MANKDDAEYAAKQIQVLAKLVAKSIQDKKTAEAIWKNPANRKTEG